MAKRGRKRLAQKDKMGAPVLVRMTPAQRRQATRDATGLGLSVGAYLRQRAGLEPAEPSKG